MHRLHCRRSRRQAGFTLVEALVSLSIAVTAASALLLGVASSFQTTQAALEQTVARGIAEQMIDEALGKLYTTPGGSPYQVGFGPNTYEQQGVARERYDDTDDFHGVTANPPVDMNGIELGKDNGTGGTRHAGFRSRTGEFTRWRETVSVYYVNNTNPSTRLTGSQTSNLRAIEVTVARKELNNVWRNVTTVRRVFGYIPTP